MDIQRPLMTAIWWVPIVLTGFVESRSAIGDFNQVLADYDDTVVTQGSSLSPMLIFWRLKCDRWILDDSKTG